MSAEHVPAYLEVLVCRVVPDPGVVLDEVVGRAIAESSRRCRRGVGVVGVNAVILQAFWQNSRDVT